MSNGSRLITKLNIEILNRKESEEMYINQSNKIDETKVSFAFDDYG